MIGLAAVSLTLGAYPISLQGSIDALLGKGDAMAVQVIQDIRQPRTLGAILVGTALDLTPTILIFAPVMLPIAVKAGIDPVYFGLMFVLNGAIGLITPPVGTVLNVVAGVGRISMHSVIKGVNPFLFTYVLILALLVVFPQIVTAPVVWLR